LHPIDRRSILSATRSGVRLDSDLVAALPGQLEQIERGEISVKELGWVGPLGAPIALARGKGVQLCCPRCSHRPRRKVAWYYREAERALAEDRQDVYV
jgi:hypothetical protein